MKLNDNVYKFHNVNFISIALSLYKIKYYIVQEHNNFVGKCSTHVALVMLRTQAVNRQNGTSSERIVCSLIEANYLELWKNTY